MNLRFLGVLLPLFLVSPPAIQADEPGTPYCFGVDCPCGNDDPAAGCINSSGLGGLLTVTGSNSIAADDLVFTGTQLPKTSVTLVGLGTAQVKKPFKDGFRCIGGTSWRLQQHLNSGQSGSVSYSKIAGKILEQGYLLTPGETLHFQLWSRDVPASHTPCAAGANLTNGYSITFAP